MARVAAAGIDWGDNRVMQGAVIALLLMAAVPGLAEAECAPRTEKLCVLVNDPGPIIQGTIVEGTDSSGYQWVVRVDRSFRGDLKGQVVVWVTYGDGSGPARFLKPGEQYLFYLQPSLADGSPGLSAVLGCGSSVALQHAQKGEVAFLARLGSRVADGRILGQVSRSRPHPDEELPYARLRVTATSAGRTFAARTKSDGSFEIAGLPPGDYHLDADLPGHELAEVEDPVELQPHGCAESDIDVQDNTRVRGHITLAAGTLSDRLRSVVAFTPDGRGVGRGSVDDRGDYEIHGIPPGDYVIGTPREDLFPRPDAPYRQTYAPGTNDLALARRVHVAIGAPVTNVDLTISSVMPTRDVVVRPRAGDRRIAPSSFTVLMRNGNQDLGRSRAHFEF